MGTSLRPLCGSSIPARARSGVSLLPSTNGHSSNRLLWLPTFFTLLLLLQLLLQRCTRQHTASSKCQRAQVRPTHQRLLELFKRGVQLGTTHKLHT
jgi:hypothetical protein